jgi:hypothetical protein
MRRMSKAQEYLQLAADCRAWADKAESDLLRQIFLHMAEDWVTAAKRADASKDTPPNSVAAM